MAIDILKAVKRMTAEELDVAAVRLEQHGRREAALPTSRTG